MDAHKHGRDVVLVCNEDAGAALRKACEHDADNDAVHLARATNSEERHVQDETRFQWLIWCPLPGGICASLTPALVSCTSMAQTSQPSPALCLCLNQPSPSHSYPCTAYNRARFTDVQTWICLLCLVSSTPVSYNNQWTSPCYKHIHLILHPMTSVEVILDISSCPAEL